MGRTVGPGEPAWLPEDTDLALGWQAEHDITCRGCGQPIDESTDPANEEAYEGHNTVCFACREMRHAANDIDGDSLLGMKFYATRTRTG